ncbi:YwiC-like family protein [Streptomyces sp. YIM S03343]
MTSRAVRRWLPNQHGAWAMLLVPFAAGTILGGPTVWHAPLLIAWMFGYLAVFHAQQWLRLRRIARNPRAAGRHVRPLVVFSLGLLPFALPLVVRAPWLLLAGACAAPFLALNCWFAWRNRERDLANGLLAVVPACGMLPVALLLGDGGQGLADSWRPALACLLYFGGTVLYVKTMIRERGSAGYRWASGVWHAVAVGVGFGLLGGWVGAFFALCLGRAVAVPALGRVRVGVVGAVEVVLSLVLLGVLVVG